MIEKALILDLDDTVFPTRSIAGETFKPFIDDQEVESDNCAECGETPHRDFASGRCSQ